jgi:selenide,water dikinase
LEVLEASGVGAVVRRSAVPVWERAVSLAAEGYFPGGLKNNREYLGEKVVADGVSPDGLLPLYDPQTSGGLLVAVPVAKIEGFVAGLCEREETAAVLGEVVEERGIRITP